MSERVTVRIPAEDLRQVDEFVQSGQFLHRSEVFRVAIRRLAAKRRLVEQEIQERGWLHWRDAPDALRYLVRRATEYSIVGRSHEPSYEV